MFRGKGRKLPNTLREVLAGTGFSTPPINVEEKGVPWINSDPGVGIALRTLE